MVQIKRKPPKYEAAMSRHAPELRLTSQRRHIYNELMTGRDHPTATDVFIRVQQKMPSISLATVYNCLETMLDHGLVKAVHVEREPTRFCANLKDHGHFICNACDHVDDIEVPRSDRFLNKLPPGTLITNQDFTLRGLCSSCASRTEGKEEIATRKNKEHLI